MFSRMKAIKDGPVFYGPRGGGLKPDVVRTVLKRDVLLEVTEWLYPTVAAPAMLKGRVHSFRHLFATAACRAGWPERIILGIMSHCSSTITRLYRHLSKAGAWMSSKCCRLLSRSVLANPDAVTQNDPHDPVDEPEVSGEPEAIKGNEDPEKPNVVDA